MTWVRPPIEAPLVSRSGSAKSSVCGVTTPTEPGRCTISETSKSKKPDRRRRVGLRSMRAWEQRMDLFSGVVAANYAARPQADQQISAK